MNSRLKRLLVARSEKPFDIAIYGACWLMNYSIFPCNLHKRRSLNRLHVAELSHEESLVQQRMVWVRSVCCNSFLLACKHSHSQTDSLCCRCERLQRIPDMERFRMSGWLSCT